MTEIDWDKYNAEKNAKKAERRTKAKEQFQEVQKLADANGFALRQCTTAHYQLTNGSWILNIYPGNQRLYSDKNHKSPFLKVPFEWTLLDIVRLLIIEKLKENPK